MRTVTARRINVPAPGEVIVIPLHAVRVHESPWDRLRRRVRTLASRESVSDASLVIVTLGLGGVLFACLHHAMHPPTPPTGLAPGVIFLP